jgi:glycosyltransferase involved in cell wall biosynthesis
MHRPVLMIGTALRTRGGIAAVVNAYKNSGYFAARRIRYIESHIDGSSWQKVCYFARAWAQLTWQILTARPAFAHLHTASDASFARKAIFCLWLQLFRVPVVLHVHGGGFVEYSASGWRRWLADRVLTAARCVIVLSEGLREQLARRFANTNMQVLANPLADPLLLEIAPGAERRAVLYLGLLTKEKGAFDLVQAALRLQDRFPDLQLHLAGVGRSAELQAAVAHAPAGLLHLHGWVDVEQRRQLLQHCAIFCLPSYYEGMPMAVLEAMAAARPSVVTAVGGVPELLQHNVEGLLIAPGDIAALASALEQLLARPADAMAMGMAARARVRAKHLPARVTQALDDIYAAAGLL